MLTRLKKTKKDRVNNSRPYSANSSLTAVRKYLTAAKNVFLPPLCLLCEKKIFKGHLCPDCREKINFLHPPLCQYCSVPLNANSVRKEFSNGAISGISAKNGLASGKKPPAAFSNGINTASLCKKCLNKSYSYHKAISITAYEEPMITLIWFFKYKNYEYLAEFFSSLMITHLSKTGFNAADYHFITSVPIHNHKLKIRGYNQAELLGKLLSNYFKIPFRNGIIFTTNAGVSQTKFSRHKRQENVKGVFAVKEELKNKKIILVDDIFTTGATINSCCMVLKEKGSGEITVITLSKTLR